MLAKSDSINEKEMATAMKSTSAPSAESSAEPVVAEVEYVLSENLKDLSDVDTQLETVLERLDSKDWTVVLEALTNVRQLAIFHAELMLPILGEVVQLVTKSVKNPRSALCKTAIMACADIFKSYHEHMLDILDPLLLQLLLKASQDKRFVCEEAERALEVMTVWIPPQHILQKLQPYVKHNNPKIRAKASVCVYNSASRLGVEDIDQTELESLLKIAAAQLNDRLPEARDASRKLLLYLHVIYRKNSPKIPISNLPESEVPAPEQDHWEQYCFKSLPAATAQAVLRVTCSDS